MLDATTASAMQDIATAKLTRVLGAERGQAALVAGLQRLGLQRLATPDDLFRLGADLERQGGFTATVGALLCLSAVMHGATTRR